MHSASIAHISIASIAITRPAATKELDGELLILHGLPRGLVKTAPEQATPSAERGNLKETGGTRAVTVALLLLQLLLQWLREATFDRSYITISMVVQGDGVS